MSLETYCFIRDTSTFVTSMLANINMVEMLECFSPLGLRKASPEEPNPRISNIPYMNGPKPSFNCMVQRVRASSRMGIGFFF